ncbi:MAG: molybdopterin biosynthesis protein [Methanospirillum sp.]|uniref:molybdopterin biosynthesis protein n=1 Tax=Methanospirillum sp. TaxID=45200 RepID=UPI0023707C47|nr:molybdopterin biosynthesis protein [Methanospirillum sp.]MDD1728084.1 molybdopterin biosynthesis protein [Methanospirillum sp.]
MVTKRKRTPLNLNLTPLSDALHQMHERFSCTPRITRIPVQKSYGRITAEAIISPLSVPAAHLSAMDGIAVKSRETKKATDQHPIILTDFERVNTGNIVPAGYDAVIMIEDVQEQDGGFLIRSSVHPWQHIRPVGEDIAETEMILPRLSRIRETDVGAMASYGITAVPVLDLKVALIPTGSEIIPVGSMPVPGEVIESNMHMVASLITAAGAKVTHFPVVPDDQDIIRATVERAAGNHDIVLISGGSSKGTKDYTAQIIADLGTVIVHGVAIKPAKPVIIGEVKSKPVIGMPGYPIACHTVLREIVMPLLGWYGFPVPAPEVIPVESSSVVQSSIGTDEFVLTTVGKIQDHWVAVPLSRGSGIQMSLVRANAYLKIPADQDILEIGTTTTASLTVQKSIAEQVVLITGSHDPSLDYLADLVREDGILISSSHVGSMGGLSSLKGGYCHLAPMHLLSANGEYNIPYLQKFYPEGDLILICIGERVQGIVSRDILGFDDITSHRFINRQKGSGTRMLLDHLLKTNNIAPKRVPGYDQEVTTHLGVCLAVQNGDADLGMTTYGAARAFSLPFIPVSSERYELVTTKQMFEKDARIKAIAEMIASQKYKNVLIHLGGYEIEHTGTIRKLNPKKRGRSSLNTDTSLS